MVVLFQVCNKTFIFATAGNPSFTNAPIWIEFHIFLHGWVYLINFFDGFYREIRKNELGALLNCTAVIRTSETSYSFDPKRKEKKEKKKAKPLILLRL